MLLLTTTNAELTAKLARLEHLLSQQQQQFVDAAVTLPPVKQQRGGGSVRKRGKQPGAAGSYLDWTANPDD
ncbi:hypothetical protein [Mycobacterium haemophilum]